MTDEDAVATIPPCPVCGAHATLEGKRITVVHSLTAHTHSVRATPAPLRDSEPSRRPRGDLYD